MSFITAAILLMQGTPATASPDPALGIRCMYDTVGVERMQSYNDQIVAKTLSIEKFAEATATDRRACIQRGAWKHQKQIDIAFSFALSMAQFVAAGKDLQSGGINPDDILGRWDDMPRDLRAAMKVGVATYPGGDAKFVADLRTFLISRTPAKQAPQLGQALELLMGYGDMLRGTDEYGDTLSPAQ
jgi:hypothetical protein